MSSAVASSSTLWATASKEWVIKPKPKPGRKPKEDTSALAAATTNDGVEVDSKGRRVQNRAAQRAFRERKQSQLAELQARIQSYEQGEIERNVALQNIAKRLKEENNDLRRENNTLKEQLARTSAERDTLLLNAKKRPRDPSPAPASTSRNARKKSKTNSIVAHIAPRISPDTYSATSVSSPATTDTPGTPISIDSEQDNSASYPPFPAVAQTHTTNRAFDESFPTFGCGFCSEDTSCICREIALQSADPAAMSHYKMERFEDSNPVLRLTAQPPLSILDNLPAFQPAIPLRRKPAGGSQSRTIFPVSSATSESTGPASCSGDPQNCEACANDTFGKAFCEAIGQSAASHTPCSDCPSGNNDILRSIDPPSQPPPVDDETVPTDSAWRQLKSHPNVSFSDLTLLADVVARRSKCTGPRVVISPAPGSITPERSSTPYGSGELGAPSIVKQEHRASPPRLVPEEVLLQCGQRQMRQVQVAGVRDALRLLDAKFS